MSILWACKKEVIRTFKPTTRTRWAVDNLVFVKIKFSELHSIHNWVFKFLPPSCASLKVFWWRAYISVKLISKS